MARRKYTANYLNALRKRVIERFLKNKQVVDESVLLVFSKGKRNSTITDFINDINISIGRIFDGQTLSTFFYREVKDGKELSLNEDQTFDSATIEDLDLYADIMRDGDLITFSNFSRLGLKGCLPIDDDYKKTFQPENLSYNRLDFYLSKNEDHLQWYGVVHGWDYPRKMIDVVKKRITECFETNSKVAAVVHGPGGSGKSLLLRKLSIGLTSVPFRVLWVMDLMDFYEYDLRHVSNCNDEFLVIIEDWHTLKENKALQSNFLSKIQKTKNIRILIGDRSPIEEKLYYNYLFEYGSFEIDNGENIDIIKKVIPFVGEWKMHENDILSSPSFCNVPIYMVFYVMTRLSEKIRKTADIVSIYREIILDDFNRISELYPGLSLAFYYWAQINRTNRIFISWSALLKIADHFDNNSFASRTLWDFDMKNPVVKLFSHYVTMKNFIIPEFSTLTYFAFHHELLTDEGISKIQFKGWRPFHPNIRYEFAEVLWKTNEKVSAYDIIVVLLVEEEIKAEKIAGGYRIWTGFENKELLELRSSAEKIFEMGLASSILLDSFVHSLFDNAGINVDEEYWINNIWYLLFKTEVISFKSCFTIIEKIIDLGCKSNCVLKTYQLIRNKEVKNLAKYFQSMKIRFYITSQRKIDGTMTHVYLKP
jgi:hypothetical protein